MRATYAAHITDSDQASAIITNVYLELWHIWKHENS